MCIIIEMSGPATELVTFSFSYFPAKDKLLPKFNKGALTRGLLQS